jgi:hypothetical protein
VPNDPLTGVINLDQQPDHCPIDETKRKQVIQELRGAFQHFVDEGRLAAIVFYDWSDSPSNKGPIFRCGALTEAGKIGFESDGDASDCLQGIGLCFNIRGNTNNSGEAIIPCPCGGSINMELNFVDQGGGFYSLRTVNGRQDLCLNIARAASSPGDGENFGDPGNLIQWSCGGSSLFDNGLFKLVDLGGGRQQLRVSTAGFVLKTLEVEAPSARTFAVRLPIKPSSQPNRDPVRYAATRRDHANADR